MDKQGIFKTSKYDFVLAAAILMFCTGVFWAVRGNNNHSGKKALIYADNKIEKEIDLAKENEMLLRFKDAAVEVEVKQRRIRISKSDCPHKICKHTGWIENSGQTIICVPNKILIEIIGSDRNTNDYQAVTY